MNDEQMSQFEQQLVEAVPEWETRLREGYSVKQMLEMTAASSTGPLASDVRAVLDEVGAGVAFPDALKHWLDRNPSNGLKLIVATMLAQRETGGNLADLLQAVGHVLKKQQSQG